MHKVYIRGYKKSTVIQKKYIVLSDMAEVEAPRCIKERIDEIRMVEVNEDQNRTYVVSIIDIIKKLNTEFEDIIIYDVGEKDMIIQYLSEAPKINFLIEWAKVFVACSIIFAGATIAIMAYQSDISLAKTFTALNKVFTGQVDTNPLWITIPYSIGIPVGVIVFFNHVGVKKLMDDPTPIEVEINTYEKEVETTMIDSINEKKRGKEE